MRPDELAHELAKPFSKGAVHWRAQTITNDGRKALALAYIDARHVMERLDAVCGVAGWQCKYSHANGKTICDLAIKINDEWIWKADGAGDTQVEAEKGAISDAFKRAAVKWGIGRYLYELDAVWCPCEVENGRFRKFTKDPWDYVKGVSAASVIREGKALCKALQESDDPSKFMVNRGDELKNYINTANEPELARNAIYSHAHLSAIALIENSDDPAGVINDQQPLMDRLKAETPIYFNAVNEAAAKRKQQLEEAA